MTLFHDHSARGTSTNDTSNALYSLVWSRLRDDNWFFFAFMCSLATIIIYELFSSSLLALCAAACFHTGWCFCASFLWVSFHRVKEKWKDWASNEVRKRENESKNMPERKWFSLKNIFSRHFTHNPNADAFFIRFQSIFFSDSWIFFHALACTQKNY